jgi:alkyl sulfatase BDS1-like metallo-beta-lactamase superfamily hydrolase
LIRIDKDDGPARHLKAAALRVIGYKQTSSSLRGFYLTGALDIEGLVDPGALQRALASQIFSAEAVPSPVLFNMWRHKINPERVADVDVRIALSRDAFNKVFEGVMTHEAANKSGAAKITGDAGVIGEFLAVLDRPDELPTPHIALR